MKILHTADLHIGQIIYQYYERADEHIYFFRQLEDYVDSLAPDLLIVAGDVFDIPQPSARYRRIFTEAFVRIRRLRPEMAIVIIAGNHDSPSRMEAESPIWELANAKVVGTPPPLNYQDRPGWEEDFIMRLPAGYVIALPYMNSERSDVARAIQEYIAGENHDGLPVVMTGHLAVTGNDFTGHPEEIGTLRTTDLEKLGEGYDYLALGHIHRPQTLGHPEDSFMEEAVYPPPVARYSGSALHVSCDETFPHSISFVETGGRGKPVTLRILPLRQLRHFVTLPLKGEAFDNQKKIMKELKKYAGCADSVYIRLRVKEATDLSSDFNNAVYALLEQEGKDLRYNPKILWERGEDCEETEKSTPLHEIQVEEIQQISDPFKFIEMTAERYPALNIPALKDAFREIELEIQSMNNED
ncbi:MAG: exonuclease SbcCD subunit D [Muribaculaceae bacterium]|nr:exonuclease SbcCD subunit D [Muribaculaceae bacterium]